jgi:hypothetical protein
MLDGGRDHVWEEKLTFRLAIARHVPFRHSPIHPHKKKDAVVPGGIFARVSLPLREEALPFLSLGGTTPT